MASEVQRYHHFHAEADILSAELQRPLQQDIKPQAFVKLPEEGGYLSQRAENFRVEGVISFHSAYTQVAGNESLKPAHGWTTLVTSVVEGLNVLDVVTADRIVAQISTDHPAMGYVPSVTFLGTRFENLKIAGHHVKPELDLGICGPKPPNDTPYIEDSAFLNRVAQQYAGINPSKNLPDLSGKKYDKGLLDLARIKEQDEKAKKGQGQRAKVECSLVNSVGQAPAGTTAFGHVIVVPDFGKIFLAELDVDRDTFHLTMIRLDLGCVAHGNGKIVKGSVNGTTKP
ncbi:MAG TPA: hypothetical protein VFA74_06685 [Terriglobales bacterium]|nr:hypothetical protein [Terriglobales bacterium]